MNAPLLDIAIAGLPQLREVLKEVTYRGMPWDLSHLTPFGLSYDIGIEAPLHVAVVFSCHCFTRDATEEELAANLIGPEDWYHDEKERRVLDEERYRLSLKYLPQLIRELDMRRITVADDRRRSGNFVTIEVEDDNGQTGLYSVFFEVTKERKRKLILRVQSAYIRPALPRREVGAKPVKLKTLLKAAFEGRTIKP